MAGHVWLAVLEILEKHIFLQLFYRFPMFSWVQKKKCKIKGTREENDKKAT